MLSKSKGNFLAVSELEYELWEYELINQLG